jgi:hypothetical protein
MSGRRFLSPGALSDPGTRPTRPPGRARSAPTLGPGANPAPWRHDFRKDLS